MKIRILRACAAWVEGDTLDVEEGRAKQLIARGLAEPLKAKGKSK